ncbi:MAG: DUF6249 domain-containing protein [Muribaculaceae bacterium]|nr:DUF6249 domain-containing protein [Muribaculaceae bacterium]
MKRIISFALIIAIAIFSASGAYATKTAIKQSGNNVTVSSNGDKATVKQNGDKVTIVSDGDTAVIESNLVKQIEQKLNDTVVNNNPDDADDADDSEVAATGDGSYHNEGAEMLDRMTPVMITSVVFGSILLIVIVILIFVYLLRRRKYRVIEKAIENNYPLPEGIFDNSKKFSSQPSPVYNPNSNSNYAVPAGNMQWRAFHSGLIVTIVGIGGILFFLTVDAEPMAAIFTIVLLIGLGKLTLTYLEQRQFTNTQYPPQQPMQPQQPVQQQQPVQPQQPQQPVQPTTPPEFNGDDAASDNQTDNNTPKA